MSFTRVDLQNRLAIHFNNPTYYTTQNFNDTIQDGTDEIVALAGTVMKSAELDYTANLTWYDMLSILPDYIGVISIFNLPTKKWLIPTSVRKLDRERLDWETCGGAPWYFTVVNHRYMGIYRKPLVQGYGRMVVYYVASSPVLTDSTAISIPDDHLQVLLDYSITDLQEQAQELTKAQLYFNSYSEGFDQLRIQIQNRRNPGRFVTLK
jgi:hypothetical protein